MWVFPGSSFPVSSSSSSSWAASRCSSGAAPMAGASSSRASCAPTSRPPRPCRRCWSPRPPPPPKAGFAQAAGRDFSYNVQTYTTYDPVPGPVIKTPATRPLARASSTLPDAAISDDLAGWYLAPLRRRRAVRRARVWRRHPAPAARARRAARHARVRIASASPSRVRLHRTGPQALNDILRRYVVGGPRGLAVRGAASGRTARRRHCPPACCALVRMAHGGKELGGRCRPHAPEPSAAPREPAGAA